MTPAGHAALLARANRLKSEGALQAETRWFWRGYAKALEDLASGAGEALSAKDALHGNAAPRAERWAAITLDIDTAQAQEDLALLAKAAEGSLQVRERLVDLFEAGVQPVRIDPDVGAAAAAGDGRIRLQLSDPFLELVSALRTGELNARIVE